MRTTYRLENQLVRAGLGPVAGADEAGRGACAGPLVAAACILSDVPHRRPRGLKDSKFLTESVRERLYDEIRAKAVAWSVVLISPAECDKMGMQEANLQALRRALLALDVRPAYALTDGFPVAGLGIPGLAVWKGDQVATSVAAASVLAKVTRDRLMVEAEESWPGYGFAVHKGYATRAHQRALEELGPSDIHRLSYANVIRAASLGRP